MSTSPTSYVPAVDPVRLAATSKMGSTNRKKAGGGKLGAQKIKISSFSDLESKAAEKERLSVNVTGPSVKLSAEDEKRQMY